MCMLYYEQDSVTIRIGTMTKRINRLEDWISAHDASQLLSEKMGRPISPKYIRSLSKSKRQLVRTQTMSSRLLYNRDDILSTTIKQKKKTDKR
jgi:hypothetical protein